jgi:hypothetical protein
MKRTARFMVAKYTPDLYRMEPRNIGVVLWADGGKTLSRFLGQQDNRKVSPPSFVEKADRHAYRQWFDYWTYQLKANSLTRDGKPSVERTSHEFLDALKEKSKAKFLMTNGGFLGQKVLASELDGALMDLFQRLVEKPVADKVRTEAADLRVACDHVFQESGIADSLTPDVTIERTVRGVKRPFTADFAVNAGSSPAAVFRRVLHSHIDSIDSSAFMFEHLLGDRLNKNNCAALLHGGHRHEADDEARAGVAMLHEMVTVIDVSEAGAIERMRAIGRGAGVML